MRVGRTNNIGNTQHRLLPLPVVGLLIVIVVFAASKALASPQEIQPTALTLQQSDVGQGYRLMVNVPARPTQKGLYPLPYQKQFVGGNMKYYVSVNVFTPTSLNEINSWATSHQVPVTNPPTIVGPYVIDHHGVFTVTSRVLLYSDVNSAIAEFHCCTYANNLANFSNYREISVHIGDEATASGGILDTPAHDPKYEMQLYAIRWRHGSVVCFVSVAGSHDVVFQDVLRLAQLQDSNITNG